MSIQVLQAALTVPPNTLAANPYQITILPLLPWLVGVTVDFPPGCLGAVMVRLSDRGGRQIIPQTGWLSGDAGRLAFSLHRRLEGAPFQVTVEGYSDATDYPHTVTIGLTMSQV